MATDFHDHDGQLSLLAPAPAETEKNKRKRPTAEEIQLKAAHYQSLDLTPGHGDLLGQPYWEVPTPFRADGTYRSTGLSPREICRAYLSDILERLPDEKYTLSTAACLGILRRAEERGKELPEKLKQALEIQAGRVPPGGCPAGVGAYHINQRHEGIDLGGISGALMATANMQMQTFVTQPQEDEAEGFDGYNGGLTGHVSSTLGTNCGMSTGRNGVMAFAANQRDEVRDLRDVAGALCACQTMKQQTLIAADAEDDCLTPWDTQQKRIVGPHAVAPTLTGADGGGGRSPGGLVLSAAFSAGQGGKAGGIGYQEECAPTLKAAESGTNRVPSVLCLNDQGGSIMHLSRDISGTLRAHAGGHQPLVYENHGIDSRYTGPHKVAPTLSARYGTGGNNVPLVEQGETFCITGNAIDRRPENGGNGLGYQADIAYTLTATDHHAVFSRQRVDAFCEDRVSSTQSARQHKDATDLVLEVSGLDCRNGRENGDLCGTLQKGSSGSSLNALHPVRTGRCIRRLTPLECERLQGFPDGWTAIPGASDAARYKALGNSVAIPCVAFIMRQIAAVGHEA